MSRPTSEKTQAPVACTLGSAQLETQAERWKKLYAEAGLARAETDEGLLVFFRRDPAVEHELLKLVAVEIECCAWADWTVEAEPAELTLAIGSTGDGIPVIHSWFLGGEPLLPLAGC